MKFGLVFLMLAASTGIDEQFSKGMDQWWTEGAERVWVEDGKLMVKADPPNDVKAGRQATVWYKQPQPENFELTLDAHILASVPEANNINLFFNYNSLDGKPLEASRESRASAEYGLYHKINGYIITFVNDPAGKGKARIRIRRNPGFELLSETFAYHSRRGETYHLRVIKRGAEIRFSINGEEVLGAKDPKPLPGGHFGLRTFRTTLWWDNIRLRPL